MRNMRNSTVLLLFFVVSSVKLYAQPDEEALMREGKQLYRLEKVSWYATDHFLANFSDRRDSIGGYLSYESDSVLYSIFFSRFDNSHVLIRYNFGAMPTPEPESVETGKLTSINAEEDLITIRQDALEKVYANQDSFFVFYKNTSLNPIPIVSEDVRKVYILTAPQQHGAVLIGNDYLLEYDNNNRFKSKKKLHNSLIQLPYASSEGQKVEASMHSHVLSNHIEPTDICTLLLYKDYVGWSKHIVVHQEYMSIFDMEKESLMILKKDVYDKISKENKKKGKN